MSYTVACGSIVGSSGPFSSYAAARSYALGVANREDVQCAITDAFGNSELVVRSGPIDPLRREYDPNRGQPFFHPHPQHPRSRERFLRNEPEAWTPGMGPAQTQVRPREFFGMTHPRYNILCDHVRTFLPITASTPEEARAKAVRWSRMGGGGSCAVIELEGCVPGMEVFRTGGLSGLGEETSMLSVFVPPLLLFGVVGALIGMQRARDINRNERSEDDLGDDVVTTQPTVRVNGRQAARTGGRSAARRLYGSAVLAAQGAASMRKLAIERRDREIARDSIELQRVSARLLDRARTYDPGFVQRKLSV